MTLTFTGAYLDVVLEPIFVITDQDHNFTASTVRKLLVPYYQIVVPSLRSSCIGYDSVLYFKFVRKNLMYCVSLDGCMFLCRCANHLVQPLLTALPQSFLSLVLLR